MRWMVFGVLCAVLGFGTDGDANKVPNCKTPPPIKTEIAGYKSIVDKIIKEATAGKYSGKFFNDLATFVDKFGNRLSGSENLENSIKHVVDKALVNGLKAKLEPVTVPYWIRGKESLQMVSPRVQNMNMLGLGFSPGTDSSGITAEIVVVSSFDELQQKAKEVPGKIVVFNNPYTSYGVSVEYRTKGPAKASKLGAVAALVRSVTPFSINSPHTGTTRFASGDKPIPSACITLEDADMLHRMYKAGNKVKVTLKMEARNAGNAVSHNIIMDIPGSINPDHYAIVSGHIDSWDVGQGALDDGVGAFLALHTLLLLKSINVPQPRRTIRAIMWTAEEQGLVGAYAYLAKHKNELKNWTVAFESDSGLYKPQGLSFKGAHEAFCVMQEIAALFKDINATTILKNDNVGSDISIFHDYGVPLADPLNEPDNYMWFHHTNGDSMRTQNSSDMDKNLAIFAAASYILANMSIPLPREGQFLYDLINLGTV